MVIAVLAVQGAFAEHEQMMEKLNIPYVELRKKDDLLQKYDGIILPGGESTVQGKLLKELDMFDTLREQILGGMPVMATCAGLILLANRLSNDEREYFKSLDVVVKPMHNISVWNSHQKQRMLFHHPILPAISAPLLCDYTVLP